MLLNEQINIDGQVYTLCHFKGEVIEQQVASQTHVSGGGGYSNSYATVMHPLVSSTDWFNNIFLVSEDGKERNFKFTNINIPPLRSGHILHVMWLYPPVGSDLYISINNISLHNRYFNKDAIKDLVREGVGSLYPIKGICLSLFVIIVISVISLFWQAVVGGSTFKPMFTMISSIGGLVFFINWINSKVERQYKELYQKVLNREQKYLGKS